MAGRRRCGRAAAAAFCGGLAVLVAPGALHAQVMIGNWMVTQHDDGASGVHPTAMLSADDGANLVVSCDAAGTDLFVSYVDQLPAGPTVDVRWKTERTPWRHQSWAVGPDQGMVSSRPAEAPRRLLAELATARTFTLRLGRHSSTFALQGTRQVANLINACPRE